MRNASLVYMWIAQYCDGQVVSQFDFNTGEETLFKNLDQTKIVNFGLCPISQALVIKVNQLQGWEAIKSKLTLPYFLMKLQPDQRLIYVRRNFIREFSYKICTKCEYKWMFMPNHKEEMSEVGLQMHQNSTTQMQDGKPYQLVVCPKCGAFNRIVCECGGLINKMKNAKDEFYYECPKCKKQHPRLIIFADGTQAEVKYLLGYQMTINKQNVKHIMYIDERGEIELSGD
jgi:hypothetical protein